MIFVLGALFFSFFDSVIMRIASPLWSGENAVAGKFWSLTDFFKSKESLIEENRLLKDRLIADELSLESSRSIESLMQTLLESYGRASSTNFIAASVLVHPPETPFDVLLVDAGSAENVRTGDVVALPSGGMIGTVVETFLKNSKVRLFSASGEKTEAVLERDLLPITLMGRGGGSFEFIIPREAAVEVGDRILSPNIESGLMGVVESVEVTPTDSFKKVLVQSIVNVYTVRLVSILK